MPLCFDTNACLPAGAGSLLSNEHFVEPAKTGNPMIVRARKPVVRWVAALLVAVAVSGGCTRDDPVIEGSPTASASATASAEPSASPSATNSSPPATADPQKLTDPADAARHLFDAWKAGDRTKALKFADQKAVDEVFSRPYTGPDPEFMGCDQEMDHYFCRFRYEGGSTTYRVDGGVSAGYQVTEVTQTAD